LFLSHANIRQSLSFARWSLRPTVMLSGELPMQFHLLLATTVYQLNFDME
jgi:hypothetical protein